MNTIVARLAKRVVLIILLLVVAVVAKHIILDGIYPTNLQPAPALAASIAPSLANSGSQNLPLAGKDFKIISSHYFDNNTWVVVSAEHLPDKNYAALVLEKINGVYTVVLGPGTSFSSTTTRSMPRDVASYMIQQGLTY